MTGNASIAIAVPTRNRPVSAARTVASIPRLQNRDFEPCVVDPHYIASDSKGNLCTAGGFCVQQCGYKGTGSR